MRINLTQFSTIRSIDRLFTIREEDITTKMIDKDFIVKMPPKRRYKLQIGAKRLKQEYERGYKNGYQQGYEIGFDDGYEDGRSERK